MTLALRAGGTPTGVVAPTVMNPSIPAGWVSGDISFLAVQVKPDTSVITTPSGWNKIGEWSGGDPVQGPDIGATKTALYYRLDQPVSFGNLSIAGASSGSAVIHIFSKTMRYWNIANLTAIADDTQAADYNATVGGANLALAAGDIAVVQHAFSSDGGTISAEAIGMAGVTFGTLNVLSDRANSAGNDIRARTYYRIATAGASSAKPTHTYTNAQAGTGHSSFLRLREDAAGSATGGAWTYAGSAVGHQPVTIKHGYGTGAWTYAASAVGERTPKGSGSGAWNFAGSAVGEKRTKGQATGAWSYAGSAEGGRTPKGSGAGAWTYAGTASGARPQGGSVSGSWSYAGSAAGVMPQRGSAAGAWTYEGTAAGASTHAGAGSGSWGYDCTAAGARPSEGTAAGTHTWTGSAEGSSPNAGDATGTWAYAGTAEGRTPPEPADVHMSATFGPPDFTATIDPTLSHATIGAGWGASILEDT